MRESKITNEAVFFFFLFAKKLIDKYLYTNFVGCTKVFAKNFFFEINSSFVKTKRCFQEIFLKSPQFLTSDSMQTMQISKRFGFLPLQLSNSSA